MTRLLAAIELVEAPRLLAALSAERYARVRITLHDGRMLVSAATQSARRTATTR